MTKKLSNAGLLAAAGILLAAALDFWITYPDWLEVIASRLYLLPIVYAGVRFGWKGGLAAVAGASLCYASVSRLGGQTGWIPGAILEFSVVGLFVGGTFGPRRASPTAEPLPSAPSQDPERLEVGAVNRLTILHQFSESLVQTNLDSLSSIEGAADVLTDSAVPDETRRELVGIIHQECRSLSQNLNNLLEFARPRAPVFRDAEVSSILDWVAGQVGDPRSGQDIVVRKDLPRDLPLLRCDSEQLQQAVLILTVAAVQAARRRGEVVLSARVEDSAMVIEVEARGEGILYSGVGEFPDPFTPRATAAPGLQLADQLVSQHGGIIRVIRDAKKGLIFSIRLSLRRRTAHDARKSVGGGR
jgi:signal transduction histidine kinase